jgi:endonuclease YncB( thermonuclease family)
MWPLCLALLLPACWATPAHAERKWRLKENCRLIANEGNDGDSFHVKWNTQTYIFRLLFVDCPETDLRIPERVQEQAAYFGITPEQAVKIGKEAARFTADQLKDGFTAYTQLDDAMGASKKDRDYAFIKIGDASLAEMMVQNGLARLHGKPEDVPGEPSADTYWGRLRKLEREAKEARRGAWAYSQTVAPSPFGALNAAPTIEPQTKTTSRSTPVYSLNPPFGQIGILTAGKELDVLRAESATMVRVRFEAGPDRVVEAQCRRADLGL